MRDVPERIYMKYLVLILILVVAIRAEETSVVDTVVSIDTPTMIGIFCNDSLDSNPDADELISDYYYHLENAADAIKAKGIEFIYLEKCNVRLMVGDESYTNSSISWGYCLVMPGKPPKWIDGIWTDIDLIMLSNAYYKTE
ncbi:MAG: hypothetical protein HQ556_08400 [Candidatus Marinimicrobia bacterium]|nr:hypothetical protein [Candidatus Neomarinimicrobiota bacterium]